MWRRILLLTAALVVTGSNSGCFINIWSADPNVRTEQLMFASEDLRQIENEWRRFWFTDQPSHLTPVRIHGGIGP